MSNRIAVKIATILDDFLLEHELILWHVEVTKEGKQKVLRVYIDKNEGYVGTQDCELVSKYLSSILDSMDDELITDSYFLEVSSAGMDRQLVTDMHIERYIGATVDVKLYSGMDGKKAFQGKLKDCDDSILTIESEDGSEIRFNRDKIAKISLAVIF